MPKFTVILSAVFSLYRVFVFLYTLGFSAERIAMQIQMLDHYTIRTSNIEASIRFYGIALNMIPGPRPLFHFPGAWLYPASAEGAPQGHSLVHLVGVDAKDAQDLTNYSGNKQPQHISGTGKLDHVAFHATGLAKTCEALQVHGITFRQCRVPEMDLCQVFIEDPNGITIELNYGAAEDLAAVVVQSPA